MNRWYPLLSQRIYEMLGPEETSTALAGTPEGSGEVAVAAAAHAPDGAVARGAFGTLPMQQLMGHLLRSHDLSPWQRRTDILGQGLLHDTRLLLLTTASWLAGLLHSPLPLAAG